jgi:hypothetical protein
VKSENYISGSKDTLLSCYDEFKSSHNNAMFKLLFDWRCQAAFVFSIELELGRFSF